MPKKISIIIISIIVIALAGAIAYVTFRPDDQGTDSPQSAGEQKPKTEETPPDHDQAPVQQSKPGTYTTYSSEAIAQTSGRKLIFFHAPWCPQCRALEADIQASTIPENMTIFKTDYDSSQDLRQKYGVTVQTTVVEVDNNGELIKKVVPYDDPTLEFVLNNL